MHNQRPTPQSQPYDSAGSSAALIKESWQKFAWIGLASALLLAAMIPVDRWAQAAFVLVAVPLLLIMRWVARDRKDSLPRAFSLLLACFLTARYLLWRFFFTLGGSHPLSVIAAFLLFFAELYAALLNFSGVFVNFFPLEREERILDLSKPVPTVDVLVPSYSEPAQLLEVTLRACRMIRYPKDRLRIYLLDDGGTDQKCADADPDKAKAAQARRAEMQDLCARLGIQYLTRAANERAKAGNINAALKHVHGDLILILDADHIPTMDILERTVPYCVDDPDIFLVQTPHFMVNPDPVDRNLLNGFRRMPSENEMFYMSIQSGLDFWDSSFFCGSAGLLRRRHLDRIGGLSGSSITEDCETALDLHTLGLKSVYVDRSMIAGLAPQSFQGFITQRMRWAQGMTQILLLKNPLWRKGLNWFQKICYFKNCAFWLFPFARLIFLAAPLAYLFFGLQIYNATLSEIAIYALPHIVASLVVTDILFGRTRWPLISDLYEIMQSIYVLPALLKVFINPRQPQFIVTPKTEIHDKDLLSPLAPPFYLLLGVMIAALGLGVWRAAAFPDSRYLTYIVMLWNTINCTLLLAALGALMERRQVRKAPRIPETMDGALLLGNGTRIACQIGDLSVGGARLLLGKNLPALTREKAAVLETVMTATGRKIRLNISILFMLRRPQQTALGVQFQPETEQERDDAVALMYGDSQKWDLLLKRRMRSMPFFRALGIILLLIWRPLFRHGQQAAQGITLRRWRRVIRHKVSSKNIA